MLLTCAIDFLSRAIRYPLIFLANLMTGTRRMPYCRPFEFLGNLKSRFPCQPNLNPLYSKPVLKMISAINVVKLWQ